MSKKDYFIADQRGAVALEMPAVFGVLMLSLFVPLADVAIAGFQYISAWEALRAFGQYIQYSPPADVTNPSTWASTASAKADPRFPISNLQVLCGDGDPPAVCSSSNVSAPVKYYSYTTTVTLSPSWVTRPALCTSSNANPCTFTLFYRERFQ